MLTVAPFMNHDALDQVVNPHILFDQMIGMTKRDIGMISYLR